MKGVTPPIYIREFRIVSESNGVRIKFFSEIMGFQNIGSKLSKTGRLPEFPQKFDTHEDAVLDLDKWNEWLKSESIFSSGTRRKGRSLQK